MAIGETYEEFVEKFKPKKTTDDCYTPEAVYDVIRDYVVEKYGLHGRLVVRPFWPGGDYENFNYPEDCVVIDNHRSRSWLKYWIFTWRSRLIFSCSRRSLRG